MISYVGPLVESPDGNVYKLVGCETTSGVGWSVGLPDRTSKAALQGIQVILARIRSLHKVNDTVSVRFHSDVEKSFEGAVLNYIQERAWLKTTTEGYDSDANSVVKRRNGKLDQCLRALLLDATGGRLYYEELWDVAMDHAHDMINSSQEAGKQTPVEKAGGDKLDIDNAVEVFGTLVYYYESPARRAVGGNQTDPPARQGLWVGRSTAISGGHRVMPIEYDQGMWHLSATIDRASVIPKIHIQALAKKIIIK